ncbi:unnamed protein product [Paramecium pentaurelia]|uniref:Uncharacterized protein n=1 Tax=Paramecium pentaurelia TaxID=43138 RepID=A0A8S1WUY1_9CILI|nr:unnamed protein product [Paramecium pentaurelia]
MINSTTSRIRDDNEDQNHRLKILEINAHQFYTQLKPLFAENTQLKQNLIELNVYIEERKMHLCKYLSDVGPNGEDLILIKAVGDLQQICDLIGDEIKRLRSQIVTQIEVQQSNEKCLKEVRSDLQKETERFLNEKQLLINQNTISQQAHKQIIENLKSKIDILLMKNEDLQSTLIRQSEVENKLRIKYRFQLEDEIKTLTNQLNNLKIAKQEEAEKYDQERRIYLKQLEQFSGKMKQVKQDIIDEYEYKMATQKVKFENQLKVTKQEISDLKYVNTQYLDKQKLWQLQQEVLIDQKYKLELQNNDLKSVISILEEKLIIQEELSIQAQNEINQQKSAISVLKQSTNPKKKSVTGTQIYSQSPQKQQSKSQTPVLESRPQSHQLWQKAANAVKKQSKDNSKMTDSQKLTNNNQQQEQHQRIILEKKTSFSNDQTNLHNNSNTEDINQTIQIRKLGSIQEIQFEHFSSATLSQRGDQNQKFVQIATQTEEQINNQVPSSRGRISSIRKTRQQFVQQYQFNHAETQYECELNDNDYFNFKLELLVSQLQNKIQSTQAMCDLKLEQKNQDIEELQNQLKSQKVNFDSQYKQIEIEMNLLHNEELESKNITIKNLKDIFDQNNDKIKELEETIKLFEINQENIHQKYEDILNKKDQEIKDIENKMQENKLMAQQEQSRLLQINQSQREQFQLELQNLQNQHTLDEQKIQQEQVKYLEEKITIEKTKQDNQQMLEQIQKKEFILENYKSELIKTNEVVKYLQLELENYKKLNNIFKQKDESGSQFITHGFLSQEAQERIKQRLQKSKISKDNPKFGFQTKDVYSMNFQIQRKERMKHAKLGTLNTSFDDKSIYSTQKNVFRFKLMDDDSQGMLQINSRRMQSQDEKSNSEIKKKQKQYKQNQRAKTQIGDYSESKLLIQDIFEKEITVLNRSNQLLSQLNDQQTKFKSVHSTYNSTKKKFIQNR